MLVLRLAEPWQIENFLALLRKDAWEYLDQTLEMMGMTWENFVEVTNQVGQVYGVYEDHQFTGYYWIEQRERVLHLHGIVVKSDFRGQGIGTAILQKLAQDFAGHVDVIELGVHDSNTRAKALYERLGFVTVRRLEELGFSVMQAPLNVIIEKVAGNDGG